MAREVKHLNLIEYVPPDSANRQRMFIFTCSVNFVIQVVTATHLRHHASLTVVVRAGGQEVDEGGFAAAWRSLQQHWPALRDSQRQGLQVLAGRGGEHQAGREGGISARKDANMHRDKKVVMALQKPWHLHQREGLGLQYSQRLGHGHQEETNRGISGEKSLLVTSYLQCLQDCEASGESCRLQSEHQEKSLLVTWVLVPAGYPTIFLRVYRFMSLYLNGKQPLLQCTPLTCLQTREASRAAPRHTLAPSGCPLHPSAPPLQLRQRAMQQILLVSLQMWLDEMLQTGEQEERRQRARPAARRCPAATSARTGASDWSSAGTAAQQLCSCSCRRARAHER